MQLNERIEKIREVCCEGNNLVFAQKINRSPQYASNITKSGKNVGDKVLDDILRAFPEVNDVWLKLGKGDMLNTPAPQAESGNTSGYETYLLPMSVMGGSLTGFAVDSVMPRDCEKIVSPIKGVDFAITIYGESMSPEYPSGSRVLVKKINPGLFIEWGKVYVLDTENGAIIKEVRKCKDKEGYVTCHSINPDPKFEDFDVPMNEIMGMYRVLMCLSAK